MSDDTSEHRRVVEIEEARLRWWQRSNTEQALEFAEFMLKNELPDITAVHDDNLLPHERRYTTCVDGRTYSITHFAFAGHLQTFTKNQFGEEYAWSYSYDELQYAVCPSVAIGFRAFRTMETK